MPPICSVASGSKSDCLMPRTGWQRSVMLVSLGDFYSRPYEGANLDYPPRNRTYSLNPSPSLVIPRRMPDSSDLGRIAHELP